MGHGKRGAAGFIKMRSFRKAETRGSFFLRSFNRDFEIRVLCALKTTWPANAEFRYRGNLIDCKMKHRQN